MPNGIKLLRRAANLTQEQLAELCNTEQSTIQRLENGKTTLNDQWATVLAEKLNVSKAEVFGYQINSGERKIPIVGRVGAGNSRFNDSSEYLGEIIFTTKKQHIVGAVVDGDSMDRVAPQGSYIIIDQSQIDIANLKGSLIVFEESDGHNEMCAGFKRYDSNGQMGFLVPESNNKEHTIKIWDSTRMKVRGKVIAIVNDFTASQGKG